MEEGSSGWTNQGRIHRESDPEGEDKIQEVGRAQGEEWERDTTHTSLLGA